MRWRSSARTLAVAAVALLLSVSVSAQTSSANVTLTTATRSPSMSSGSGSAAGADVVIRAPVSTATSSAPPATTLAPPPTPAPRTPAPIASAAPDSSTFELVSNVVCPDIAVEKITAIYNKNRAIFDECVRSAGYQIFPHSGAHPTAAQVHAMATSRSCIAIFVAVEVADFPVCDVGGMPLKSAVETLLKIKADIDSGREAASAARFQELMLWRRDVNLAQAAGVPHDSDSALYKEYTTSLQTALSGSTVRVAADLTLEYLLPNGTYTRGVLSFSDLHDIESLAASTEDVVATVRPASSSDSDRSATWVDSSGKNSSVVHVNAQSSASGLYDSWCAFAWSLVVLLAATAAC